MIQIFGTTKCKATRAAQRFFSERRIKVHFIDLRQKAMSKGELSSVAKALGGVRALYDAEGERVVERGLRHAAPDDARITELLLADALLLRTPIVRNGAKAAVGVAEAAWRAFAEAS